HTVKVAFDLARASQLAVLVIFRPQAVRVSVDKERLRPHTAIRMILHYRPGPAVVHVRDFKLEFPRRPVSPPRPYPHRVIYVVGKPVPIASYLTLPLEISVYVVRFPQAVHLPGVKGRLILDVTVRMVLHRPALQQVVDIIAFKTQGSVPEIVPVPRARAQWVIPGVQKAVAVAVGFSGKVDMAVPVVLRPLSSEAPVVKEHLVMGITVVVILHHAAHEEIVRVRALKDGDSVGVEVAPRSRAQRMFEGVDPPVLLPVRFADRLQLTVLVVLLPRTHQLSVAKVRDIPRLAAVIVAHGSAFEQT